MLVLEDAVLPGREEIVLIVMTTVLLSIIAHGMSAYPAAKRYAARTESLKAQPGAAEHMEVSEMPVRVKHDA